MSGTKKILLRVKGGVGNQLFILNFALYLRDSGYTIFLDNISGFFRDPYKRVYQLSSILKEIPINSSKILLLKYFVLKIIGFFLRKKSRFLLTENEFHANHLLNENYLEGYFQNAEYLSSSNLLLMSGLLNYELIEREISLLQDISKQNSCVLHIRLVDYDVLGFEYYLKALKYWKNLNRKSNIYVFSDDISLVKEKLKEEDDLVFVDFINDPIKEFLLMTLCSNFIIANSTFSFWAACLSKSNNKSVIAPVNSQLNASGDFYPDYFTLM